MRNAYAILGIAFIVVFGGTYLAVERAHAPEAPLVDNSIEEMTMKLSSEAFVDGEMIPAQYTCDGENTNPPLRIENVPEGTESLVLIMDDPDIPQEVKDARGIEKFDHWVVYNLSPDITDIKIGTAIGSIGNNSRAEAVYTGPCPPTEYEPTTHRYIFRLYALSGQLNFITTPTLDEVEAAAQGSMIAKAELMGRYTRVTEVTE
jgi:Raf kinase inhibitor-like YbhB/YbcL family protein